MYRVYSLVTPLAPGVSALFCVWKKRLVQPADTHGCVGSVFFFFFFFARGRILIMAIMVSTPRQSPLFPPASHFPLPQPVTFKPLLSARLRKQTPWSVSLPALQCRVLLRHGCCRECQGEGRTAAVPAACCARGGWRNNRRCN